MKKTFTGWIGEKSLMEAEKGDWDISRLISVIFPKKGLLLGPNPSKVKVTVETVEK